MLNNTIDIQEISKRVHRRCLCIKNYSEKDIKMRERFKEICKKLSYITVEIDEISTETIYSITPFFTGCVRYNDNKIVFKAFFIRGMWNITSFKQILCHQARVKINILGFQFLRMSKQYKYPKKFYIQELIKMYDSH